MIDPAKTAALIEQDAALLQSPEAQAILRALEARLAAIPQIAALEVKADEFIPGWRTSEFWMTALGHAGLIAAAASGHLSPQNAAIAGAVSQLAYNLSRGLAKGGISK